MIQLSSAGKRYGHKLLFEDADWLITPESHVGLVGANGTGKSTVMKILAGMESLDYGSISRAKGISTGYLPQDGLTMTGRTVFAVGANGHVWVHPDKDPARGIDLKELVDNLQLRGISLPILIRFGEILKHRLGEMHQAFQNAIAEHNYKAPIAACIRSRSTSSGRW